MAMKTGTLHTWHASRGSGGQGLVISDVTGENIAGAYDEKNTALLAAAPALLNALRDLMRNVDEDLSGYWTESTANMMQQAQSVIREIENP